MNKTRLTWITALFILIIIFITLDFKLISAIQDKKEAHSSQTEISKIYSLQPAQLKIEIATLQKRLDALPVKVKPTSEKNRWISELSAKAAEYMLDLTSLTPADSSPAPNGLEKQIITIDLLGPYKNTLFFFDDLARSGNAIILHSLQMRCDRSGEPVKTHSEIQILWSPE